MSEVTTAPKGDLFVHPDPIQTLLSPEKFEAFLVEIKKETGALVPDISTQRGRDEIKRVAFKVTKTKTFLDDLGKKLNEKRREEINKVDKARRDMRDALDELKDEVRKPLTEWEEAEQDRILTIERTMEFLRNAGSRVDADDHTERLKERLRIVEAAGIDPKVFGEETIFAEQARTAAVQFIKNRIQHLKEMEEQRAELDRLRAAERERQEADRLASIAEANRKAEEERETKEAAKQREREENAVRAAHEAAKREAEAELRKEREERMRLEDAERARQAEEKRIADEASARQRDADHRLRVRTEAANKISELGAIGLPKADKIVMAIIAGEIPHVRLEF